VNELCRLLRQRRASSEPALIEGRSGRSISWAEVADLSAWWAAAALPSSVGLALASPLDMAAHLVAAMSAGVLVAPLDPNAPARDRSARLEECCAGALVTDGAGPHGLRILPTPGSSALPALPVQPVLLLSSSGSTGTPKLIPLEASQLLQTASGVAEHLGLGPGERGYSPLPLFHINGIVVGVLAALVSGADVVVDGRFSRRSFWATVRDRQVTWINAVPAILAILANTVSPGSGPRAGQLRLARSASAPLAGAVRERFERRFGVKVIETYGMTEVASQITANPLGTPRPGSVGLPVGVQLRVVGASGERVGAGVEGRVQVRGPAVASHCWRRSNNELQCYPALGDGGWLDTGDLGSLDHDGYLYLSGRQGETINRGGEKIRPREVEEVLLGHPRVAVAVVVGRPHPTLGEEPVAYVTTASPASPAQRAAIAADLERCCAESLSAFKRPASIEVVESLPAGPTGKVRRVEVARSEMLSFKGSPRSDDSLGHSVLLSLPDRSTKPRRAGLTSCIDNGLSHGAFADLIATAATYVDLVKFGWGTALVTPDMHRKFEVLSSAGIDYFFGGTLFEKFVLQDRFESFLTLCRMCGCRYLEISNGTVDIEAGEKARYIEQAVQAGFLVLSEVGHKDPARSDELTPAMWVQAIKQDLAAGASLVITEARESGRAGLCHRNGTFRDETLEAILAGGVDPSLLIFEAPTKELQTHLIARLGPDVNLGNVAPADVIALETLRLGLRSETLIALEEGYTHAQP